MHPRVSNETIWSRPLKIYPIEDKFNSKVINFGINLPDVLKPYTNGDAWNKIAVPIENISRQSHKYQHLMTKTTFLIAVIALLFIADMLFHQDNFWGFFILYTLVTFAVLTLLLWIAMASNTFYTLNLISEHVQQLSAQHWDNRLTFIKSKWYKCLHDFSSSYLKINIEEIRQRSGFRDTEYHQTVNAPARMQDEIFFLDNNTDASNKHSAVFEQVLDEYYAEDHLFNGINVLEKSPTILERTAAIIKDPQDQDNYYNEFLNDESHEEAEEDDDEFVDDEEPRVVGKPITPDEEEDSSATTGIYLHQVHQTTENSHDWEQKPPQQEDHEVDDDDATEDEAEGGSITAAVEEETGHYSAADEESVEGESLVAGSTTSFLSSLSARTVSSRSAGSVSLSSSEWYG